MFRSVLYYEKYLTIFDLLFIVLFLTAAGTLLYIAILAISGRGARARVVLRRFGICAGAYFAILVSASVFWPRTVLRVGERRCFDDWCIGVNSAGRQPADGPDAYLVRLQLSSTALRVTQRENNVIVYMSDDSGRRYDPMPGKSDVPINVQLGPGESRAAARVFEVPAGARDLGLVIDHEGGFPIGWFIIGDETWFHKPTIVRLP